MWLNGRFQTHNVANATEYIDSILKLFEGKSDLEHAKPEGTFMILIAFYNHIEWHTNHLRWRSRSHFAHVHSLALTFLSAYGFSAHVL